MRWLALFVLLVPSGCRPDGPEREARLARDYVELVKAQERSEDVGARARSLLGALQELEPSPRVRYLERQVRSMVASYDVPGVGASSFDEESLRLYGVVAEAPDLDEAARIRAELDSLLPGDGSLVSRYTEFQRRFLVPEEKLVAVFERAIDLCRSRTLAHVALPKEESTELELVSGKDWPAFSTYLGNYRSVIRLNADFPVPVGRVVEIAAHEAYPGHHTASVLRDETLVRGRGLLEFSVEPLVGEDAYLREALAVAAAGTAVSPEERLAFERDVLFPLVSLDPADAARHAEVERLVSRLRPLLVDAARQYLDGNRDRVASAIWLENEALVSDPWAFLRFVDRYRTYVVSYASSPSVSWRSLTSLLLVSPHEPT